MSWKIDPVHTEINFTARHMMISNVRGRFEKFSGTVEFDEKNPTVSAVNVEIEAASINTKEPQRDGHLRSPDFFNADKYPYLIFRSTRIEAVDESHGRIYGDLTIRDVTRPVVLETTFNGIAKSPMGTTNAGFSATTRVNRKEWGLNWNVALETGGWLVGDEINISIEVEIIQQAATAPAAETAKATQ